MRTHLDVLPQLLHTLLDTEYNTPTVFCLASYSTVLQVSPHRFNSCTATLPLLACSDSVTTGWSLVFNSLVCCSSATTAFWNSPTGSVPILSDYNTILLPTAFLRTGLAFALQRVKPNPSLFRWTIAGGSLWETCLWSSCLLYPLWTLNRPSIPFVISNYVTTITSFTSMSTTFFKKV